jgi:nucleotide-binding universal stress UspA family protein
MFRRILVPLDGTAFAERALEPAFRIAREFAGQVVLLRVTTPEEDLARLPPLAPHFVGASGNGLLHKHEEAEAYLCQTCTAWAGQGVSLQSAVVCGTPAQMIVDAAHEADADLIVMSTHGRSGVGRLLYGSVAEAVLRGAQVPVLLVPFRP